MIPASGPRRAAVLLAAAMLALAPGRVRADDPAPAPRLWEFAYSKAGRPTAIRDPIGDEQRIHYDDVGRLDRIDFPGGGQVAYGYGEGSYPTSRRDAAGEWRFSYDPLGELTAFQAPNGDAVRYDYDGGGRVRRIAVGDAWWLTYDYDLFDRLTKVGSPIGNVTFQRDLNRTIDGQPRRQLVRRLPNGVTTTWTFDSGGRLVGLRHDHGDTLLGGWTYDYDAMGRVAHIQDAAERASYAYAYDTAGRLTEVRRDGELVESYGYDAAGKLRRAQWEAASRSFEFDGFGQLAKADGHARHYDRLGRLTGEETPARGRQYRYDGAGHLVGAEIDGTDIRYVYDAGGHLVRRESDVASTFWLRDAHDPGAPVLAIFGDGKLAAVRLLAGRPVATSYASGETRFLLEDHLGNVRVVTDSDGRVVGRRSYSSFGTSPTVDAANVGPGFGDGIADPQSGLLHLGVRWYDPATGQFLTPDPRFGDLRDPRRLDRYQYALADPINNADPSGMASEAVGKQSGAIPDWRDFEGDVNYIRNLIEQRVIANYLAEGGAWNPGTELANFGWEFTGAGLDYFTGPFRTAQAAGSSWTAFSLDPSLQRFEIATLRTGASALDTLFLTNPEGKLVARGSVAFMSRSGLLDKMISSGTTGTVNRELASGIPFAVDAINKQIAKVPESAASSIDRGIRGELSEPSATGRAGGRPPAPLGLPVIGWRSLSDPNGGGCGSGSSRCPPPTAYGAGGPPRRPPPSPLADASRGDNPPPPPPTISVGGVYLDPQAQELVHLGTLKGVSIDNATGRVVLVGEAARPTTAQVDLDHLAVAVKAATENGLWPGVTIEPPPGNPEANTAYYRYFGPATEHTRFGGVLALADRWMKSISLGFDNEHPDQAVRPAVPDYQDMFELGAAHSGDTGGWARFWIVPERINWQTSADGLTLWCSEARMAVRTQTMAVENGRLVDTPGLRRASDEAFSAWFTDHYDELAQIYPVYAELRELAKLVSLASLLRDRLPPQEFAKLSQVLAPARADTPATTPAIHRTRPEGHFSISIRGGVDLEPAKGDAAAVAGPQGDALKQAIDRAVPHEAVPSVGAVDVDGRSYQAVALPMASLWHPGALTLDEQDFAGGAWGITARRYGSADRTTGPLGPGWQLRRTRVKLPDQGSGRQPVVPPEVLGMVGLSEPPEFTLIERGEADVQLHTTDGHLWRTGSDGRVLRIESDRATVEYAEENGRLELITRRPRLGQAWQTQFVYGGDRLRSIVDDRLGRVDYRYGLDGLLSEMRSGNRLVRYEYDEHGHLRQRSDNGEAIGFSIAADGSMLARTDADGYRVSYRSEPEHDGGLRRVTVGAGGSETMRYDGHGDATAVEGSGWSITTAQKGEVVTQSLRMGSEIVWRNEADLRDGSLTRDILDDRTVSVDLRPDGTTKSARIRAPHGDEQVDVRFDDDGEWLSIAETGGASLQRIRGLDGVVRAFSTPAGTYRFSTDAAMRSVTVDGPESMRLRVALDESGRVQDVAEGRGATEVDWRRSEKGSWELRQAGRLLRQITLDPEGRVTSAKSGDATVRAQYGPGGSLVVMPDGRQSVIRVDRNGRVVEFEEHAAGVPDLSLPLPDLTGDVRVEQQIVTLKRPEKNP